MSTQLSKKTRKKVIGRRLPKSSMKQQPECGGIQRPNKAVTPVATTTIYGIGRKLT